MTRDDFIADTAAKLLAGEMSTIAEEAECERREVERSVRLAIDLANELEHQKLSPWGR